MSKKKKNKESKAVETAPEASAPESDAPEVTVVETETTAEPIEAENAPEVESVPETEETTPAEVPETQEFEDPEAFTETINEAVELEELPENELHDGPAEGTIAQTSAETLELVIESILFASQKPMSAKELTAVLKGAAEAAKEIPDSVARLFAKVKEPQIREAIERLELKCAMNTNAYEVRESAAGWQLVTKPNFAPWLRQLFPENRSARLSAPAMETLAIIAYRQPITRADIEAVRGVAVDGVMQTLLDRGLLKIAGRAEVPGRPLLYETTQFFMEHFGLKDLDDLPNAAELRRISLPTAEPPVEARPAATEPPAAVETPADTNEAMPETPESSPDATEPPAETAEAPADEAKAPDAEEQPEAPAPAENEPISENSAESPSEESTSSEPLDKEPSVSEDENQHP